MSFDFTFAGRPFTSLRSILTVGGLVLLVSPLLVLNLRTGESLYQSQMQNDNGRPIGHSFTPAAADGIGNINNHAKNSEETKESSANIAAIANSQFYPSEDGAFFRRLETAGKLTPLVMKKQRLKSTLIETKSKKLITCNAPKTGCTAWKFFWEYVNTGKRWDQDLIEKNPGLIHTRYGDRIKMNGGINPLWHNKRSDEEIINLFETIEMVLVARNPYIRFLSSYQDWIRRVGKDETKVPFSLFAEKFLKYQRDGERSDFFGNAPIDHIQTVSSFCQVGIYNYTVLRVEEQALWYNEFLEKYNLKEKMDAYNSHGNLVYSSGIRGDATVKDYTTFISGRQPWPSQLFNSAHHRDSSGKITKYYTPTIAKKVTEIVWDDLVNFGYPVWDGIADNFRFV